MIVSPTKFCLFCCKTWTYLALDARYSLRMAVFWIKITKLRQQIVLFIYLFHVTSRITHCYLNVLKSLSSEEKSENGSLKSPASFISPGLFKVVYIRITVYMYFFSMMASNYIKTYLSETYPSIASSFWFWTPHPPLRASSASAIEAGPPTPP